MTNNAPGGQGNDLALDDIMFRPCGPVVTSIIQGVSLPVNVCVYEQQSYTLAGSLSPGFVNPVYQWQQSLDSGRTWTDIPGASGAAYTRPPSGEGRFRYRLSVAESGNAGIASCRIASEQLEVNIHPRPQVSAGPDKIRVAGYSDTRFNGVVSGDNVQYRWTPPDYLSSDTSLQPIVTSVGDMQYLLTAVSGAGCTNEDAVLVKVVAGVFVPNAFTPNNDGKNDRWTIPFLDPSWGARVMVFDRAGQLVYQARGVAVDWDGNFKGMPLDAGSFVYFIQFADGKPDLKGTLTIIR
jgi:gliding motility-associated-like protein